MSENTQFAPPSSAPERMGLPSRFLGIFFSPGRVFHYISRNPVWIGPLLIVACFVALLNLTLMSTAKGQSILRENIEERVRGSGITLTEEQLDTQIRAGKILGPASALILLPLTCFLLAGIVYLVFNVLLGGDRTYRQVLSACSHILPISVPHSLIATALIYSKGSFQATTSLAAFAPFLEQETLGYRILQGLDIFYLWQLGVLSIGLAILYRFTPKKCASILFGIYLVLVVGISWIAQAFS